MTSCKLIIAVTDPQGVQALAAYQLIDLDKNPSIRLIGIGEVARGVISKSILRTISFELFGAAGTYQLCVGKRASHEAAGSALTSVFNDFFLMRIEGVLLVDGRNAFNELIGQLVFLNLYVECRAMATFPTNLYRKPANLFIDGEMILSQ